MSHWFFELDWYVSVITSHHTYWWILNWALELSSLISIFSSTHYLISLAWLINRRHWWRTTNPWFLELDSLLMVESLSNHQSLRLIHLFGSLWLLGVMILRCGYLILLNLVYDKIKIHHLVLIYRMKIRILARRIRIYIGIICSFDRVLKYQVSWRSSYFDWGLPSSKSSYIDTWQILFS